MVGSRRGWFLTLILLEGVFLAVAYRSGGSQEDDYMPKFFKSGKYADAFKNKQPSERFEGTKTGPKQGVKTIKKPPSVPTACPSPPMASMNSEVRCTSPNGCQGKCSPGFAFPNGDTRVFITCINGRWEIEGTEWDTLPHCLPKCLPECQNNGICISPNECQCVDGFSGQFCEAQAKPCLGLPELPMNSRRTCFENICTIACLEGFKFPDGSGTVNMQCENGQWVTSNGNLYNSPDCQATCNPPCLNGGNCLSLNVCQCPVDYHGPQCQYSADACNFKKLDFNGGYNCSGDYETFSCSVFCPEGIQFESSPADVYQCEYSTGKFAPFPIPQCVFPSKFDIIPISNGYHLNHVVTNSSYSKHSYGYGSVVTARPDHGFEYAVINENVIATRPASGRCVTWGGVHFKTFDGKLYSYESNCPHKLLGDKLESSFDIILANKEGCEKETECFKVITIFYQGKKYVLQRGENGAPTFGNGKKKQFPVPYSLPGIRIDMEAHYMVVKLDVIGVTLKYDGKMRVEITASESLWKRTEGLCGFFDGVKENDFTSYDGYVQDTVGPFASSWQADSLESTTSCFSNPLTLECLSPSAEAAARSFCESLLKKISSSCSNKNLDLKEQMKMCTRDYCNCYAPHPSECACETATVLAEDCSNNNWRDKEVCPMKCDGGRIYMRCAPEHGVRTCGDIQTEHSASTSTSTSTSSTFCVEGCYCPSGTVLQPYGDRCIAKEECPCRLRGKDFQPGSQVTKECNTCTCTAGQWTCTQVPCGSRCASVGDPHYTTFDGKKYDFMGKCSYYLVKGEGGHYSVEAENVACPGSISKAMKFPVHVEAGMPSCTKSVTINIEGHKIKFKKDNVVLLDGVEVAELPYTGLGFTVRQASSVFIIAELDNGVNVWWDGVTSAYVDIPPSFQGKTEGLCGTYNGNQQDDFITPEGDVETSPIAFANKWKTKDTCEDLPTKEPAHPCELNAQRRETAEKYCDKLTSDLFADCHTFVDPESYRKDCIFDMCSCETKMSDCLCPLIAAYAKECAHQNVIVDWRKQIRECGMSCPRGQEYQVCGDSCARTCSDISRPQKCRSQCVEGCNCPKGYVLDEYLECIPIGRCPCQNNGVEFSAGYKEVRPGTKSLQLCTCTNGVWDCKRAAEEDTTKYPKASDIKALCSPGSFLEFTSCEPIEPITCKNMHAYQPTSPAKCSSGCKCMKDYVLDAVSKHCILPSQCPCHHGGTSYSEGEAIQVDCNKCVCKGGNWTCDRFDCSSTCSSWGDSHFKTFDGKMYDYQGECDYVLAKGVMEDDFDSFYIYMQNVACSSLGSTCSRSLVLNVGSGSSAESIILDKGRPIRGNFQQRMLIKQTHMFVTVLVEDLGLVLHWDKGTRIYVTLEPKWRSKVKGLCGNYNGDQSDDFQSPSGGISEALASTFADAWKVHPYCPETTETIDTCSERPERKMWAQKKCGLLKMAPFSKCHSEVPFEPYMERCIKDSCACDEGGDCECLCTALAAYAQECNIRGVTIKWRSQGLCPIQCDEKCSSYSPCVSSCPPENCDNYLTVERGRVLCNATFCVEGCKPVSCPPGQLRVNATSAECVPVSQCKPICTKIANVVYYEGDPMETDDCRSCYCSKGKKICSGLPCSKPVTDPPKKFRDQSKKCSSGWTSWINQNVVNDVGKELSDIEPLPSTLLLSEINSKAFCSQSHMKKIKCRTVVGHQESKSTGLDVECSLERGLVCKPDGFNKIFGADCVDFEISVFCDCGDVVATTPQASCDVSAPPAEHPTDCASYYRCVGDAAGAYMVEERCESNMLFNPVRHECDYAAIVEMLRPECRELTPATTEQLWEYITDPAIIDEAGEGKKVITNCSNGLYHSPCAINCERLCLHYDHIVRESGKCLQKQKCEEGCVSAEKRLECPKGMVWRDAVTCVEMRHCLCVSNSGVPVKPGVVYRESDCEVCQCIDNQYICDRSTCKDQVKIVSESPTSTERYIAEMTTPAIQGFTPVVIVVDTASPPPYCNIYNFVNLLAGLPDEAFTASSIMGPSFMPHYARLHSEVEEVSGGSWVPADFDTDQYLQIDFSKPTPIYGAVLQGSPMYDEFITSYKVMYSDDGRVFSYYTGRDRQPQVLKGPIEQHAPVRQLFEPPFEARYVRIVPMTWHNGISMRLDLVGCDLIAVPTTAVAPSALPLCEDYMGVDSGTLPQSWITASSEFPGSGKERLRISEFGGWKPFVDSQSEYVMFDFSDTRNITGVLTKGGPDGWVTAYHVSFSQDGRNWSPLLDNMMERRTFLGNFDTNTAQSSYFDMPLHARYLKVEPTKWHGKIQMRIEPIGCYVESVFTPQPAEPTVVFNVTCNICPMILDYAEPPCKCRKNLYWNGENCVQRSECPCVVGHIPYAVGTLFEKDEDCSECLCKIGGVEHCSPKKCSPCGKDLRSHLKANCQCSCEPCSKGEKLCPTDNMCINEASWCDGVQDCSDDEISCLTATVFTPSSTSCPEPSCPPDYDLVYIDVELFDLLDVRFDHGCRQFKCIPREVKKHVDSCTRPKCPPGYEPSIESTDENGCVNFVCKPEPLKDAVCNVTGRTFNTFDGTEFKHDICDHTLAKGDFWEISFQKNCQESCTRSLTVSLRNHTMKINSDLMVEYNDYVFTVGQMSKIAAKSKDYEIVRVGDSVSFNCPPCGFWFAWDGSSNVKITIAGWTASGKGVSGLCGLFDSDPTNDKTKPDGSRAASTVEFANSWSRGDVGACEPKACPVHAQQEAWEMCRTARNRTLEKCEHVMDMEEFVSRCLETYCECISINSTDKEKCRCQTIQDFAIECMAADPHVEILDWRLHHDCAADCESPFVHQDCYRRRCEPTCDNYEDENACPSSFHVCFPGCYCPPGYIRRENTCVLPSDCNNCECDLLENQQIVQFDNAVTRLGRNCTYTLARSPGKEGFQVLVTNGPCDTAAKSVCIEKITILFGGHKIYVYRSMKSDRVHVAVDQVVKKLPFKADWVRIERKVNNHVFISIPEAHLEITVSHPHLATSIRAPSQIYGGKLEGLCGNCNKNPLDDEKMPSGATSSNHDELLKSWLFDVPGVKEVNCFEEEVKTCKLIRPDPCKALMDTTKFGHCHVLIDPAPFFDACHETTCQRGSGAVCEALEAYSRRCLDAGVCTEWRSPELCPAAPCQPGFRYEACGTACPATCETSAQTWCTGLAEGCFCPPGLVVKNGTCAEERSCRPCDEEGHYHGDTWKPDRCTRCACEGTVVQCSRMECSGVGTVCPKGQEAVQVPASDEECCPKFVCAPIQKSSIKCKEPEPIQCSYGQVMKLDFTNEGCKRFICQCKPKEDCDPISEHGKESMEPGMIRLINSSNCCPEVYYECKPKTCPKPDPCPKYHLAAETVLPGICCPIQTCQLPSDKCLYEHRFKDGINGGEKMRNDEDKYVDLKNLGEFWHDGPCRECSCIKTETGEHQASCSLTLCYEEGNPDYELEPLNIPTKCCPEMIRVACKHEGKIYQVGESWKISNESCTLMKCVHNSLGVIEKEKIVQQCNKDCDLGMKYEEPSGSECCGTCVPHSCIFDGKIMKIDQEWSSEDHCTKYTCMNSDGSLHVHSKVTICAQVSNELWKEYAYESHKKDGECCPENVAVACLDHKNMYKEGDIWASPDGDLCKKVTCIKTESGDVLKQDIIETCNKDCALGWEYEPSQKSCCGECKQVACVLGDAVKPIGSIWYSDDNCTTFACEKSDDHTFVSSSQHVCPPLDDCPEENVYSEGCCKFCNVSAASMKLCVPEEIRPELTIGAVQVKLKPHGLCKNKVAVKGLKQCKGHCFSSTFYNLAIENHEAVCSCCQVAKDTEISVKLHCEDGYKLVRKIKVPTDCHCKSCPGA